MSVSVTKPDKLFPRKPKEKFVTTLYKPQLDTIFATEDYIS